MGALDTNLHLNHSKHGLKGKLFVFCMSKQPEKSASGRVGARSLMNFQLVVSFLVVVGGVLVVFPQLLIIFLLGVSFVMGAGVAGLQPISERPSGPLFPATRFSVVRANPQPETGRLVELRKWGRVEFWRDTMGEEVAQDSAPPPLPHKSPQLGSLDELLLLRWLAVVFKGLRIARHQAFRRKVVCVGNAVWVGGRKREEHGDF